VESKHSGVVDISHVWMILWFFVGPILTTYTIYVPYFYVSKLFPV
jgi:hypothetical protein